MMKHQHTEPQPPRTRGRPRGTTRAVEHLEPLSTRVPLPVYDRLCEMANQRGESVSMLVRHLLVLRLKP